MITIKEIKQRCETPYTYEAPYYLFHGKLINGKPFDIKKNYYQVHEDTSFEQDIKTYLTQLPEALVSWIMARITYGMETGNLTLLTNDAIFAYIDIAHFGYFGVFAE
jgi:hypothetical protein